MLTISRYKWLIILLAAIPLISACRYWSLYKFSQQFCEFDEQIEVIQKDLRVGFHLIDPVLPRAVFQGYLAAPNIESLQSQYELRDAYQIQSASDDKRYKIYTQYHLGSKKPLLMAGELDEPLSDIFSTSFVEPMLRSFCTDDFDLSLKKLVARMKIENLSNDSIPNRSTFTSAFGAPVSASQTEDSSHLIYTFHFLDAEGQLQTKPMTFSLQFQSLGNLSKMRVTYHKYDYSVDFTTREAKLIAIRRK